MSSPPRRRILGPVLDDPGESNEPIVELPAPPKRRMIGPVLDDNDNDNKDKADDEQEEPVYEGPVRPPSATKASTEPPSNPGKKRTLDTRVFVGPPRPVGSSNDDEEDESSVKLRADEWETVKRQEKSTTAKREEWMTELPPERSTNATVLLTNRQFSRKDNVARRGDTSMWTDTPADREKKRQKGPEGSLKELAGQDFDSQKEDANRKFIEQHNKKYRAKSLAEIHQEELKKKQAEIKDEDKPLWTPFDRTDLERRVADPKTAAKLIQNSHNLNDRFGASSKRFL